MEFNLLNSFGVYWKYLFRQGRQNLGFAVQSWLTFHAVYLSSWLKIWELGVTKIPVSTGSTCYYVSRMWKCFECIQQRRITWSNCFLVVFSRNIRESMGDRRILEECFFVALIFLDKKGYVEIVVSVLEWKIYAKSMCGAWAVNGVPWVEWSSKSELKFQWFTFWVLRDWCIRYELKFQVSTEVLCLGELRTWVSKPRMEFHDHPARFVSRLDLEELEA